MLDVAMDDALLVRVAEPGQGLADPGQRLGPRDPRARLGEEVRQTAAIQVLDDEEPLPAVLQVIENPRDVGMTELRLQVGFTLKTLAEGILGFQTRRQNLDRREGGE